MDIKNMHYINNKRIKNHHRFIAFWAFQVEFCLKQNLTYTFGRNMLLQTQNSMYNIYMCVH